jgi:hypothetical protein
VATLVEKRLSLAHQNGLSLAHMFASDLYAGGNVYRWQILQFVGDIFFTAGEFSMCAGDNMLSLANL